ncbi:hypothetical protein BC829DRAFT_443217 [Chytridium lagenaria]|nr:hypothetical protein BC829DRAFT_443217 [Chytridium lagenaria]
MAVQTNTAMFWFRFLQTGYGRSARPGRALTAYGRSARPGCLLVPVLTDGLRPARPTRPYFGSDRLRPALPTRPYYGTGFYRPVTAGPPAPAVFRYRFLQTGYGRPARPGRALTGYGRPARPGRISVPVLTAVFRYWFLQPGYGRPARPGRALNGYGRPARPGRISVIVLADRLRPARPTRPYFGNCSCRPVTAGPPDPAVFRYRFLQTGYGRVTALSSGPGRVGSETAIPHDHSDIATPGRIENLELLYLGNVS